MTDGYSKLENDVEFRKQVAENVGIGFELVPKLVPNPVNLTKGRLVSAA